MMDDGFDGRLVYSDSDEELDNRTNEQINDDTKIDEAPSSNTIEETNDRGPTISCSPNDISVDQQSNDESKLAASNSDDDGDFAPMRKMPKKKNVQLTDSDESDSANCEDTVCPPSDRLSESGNDDVDAQILNATNRPNIWDSDTSCSNHEEDSNSDRVEAKKHKKRKQRPRERKESEDGSSDEDDVPSNDAKGKMNTARSDDSGESNDQDSNSDHSTTPNIAVREKTEKRKAAQECQDQMKEILSESQRLAREIYVNVPYHKPKQFSLKEFMSRRCIAQSQRMPVLQKAAAAIKMSEADLANYARCLEQRAEESITFFKNETDEDTANGDDEEVASSQPIVNAECVPNEGNSIEASASMPTDESVNSGAVAEVAETETQESSPIDMQTVAVEELPSTSKEITVAASSHVDDRILSAGIAAEQNEHHIELKMMEQPNELKISRILAVNDDAPRLSGDVGMVIDLETNEVKVKAKTGADLLMERFLKSTTNGPMKNDTYELSIFNPDVGMLQSHKLCSKTIGGKEKDPKPGESFFKLKNELSKKITDKRKEIITKRMLEEGERHHDDGTDDETEEFSECGEATDDDEEDDEANGSSLKEAVVSEDEDSGDKNDITLFDDEEESLQVYEDEENSEESDSNHAEERSTDHCDDGGEKKRRILTAFQDDSDDEIDISRQQNCQSPKATAITSTISEEFSNTQGILFTQPNKRRTESEILFNDSVFEFDKSNQQMSPDNSSAAPIGLFTQKDGNETVCESQLEALCSGTFATQMTCEGMENQTQSVIFSQLQTEIKGKIESGDTDQSQSQSNNDVLDALLSSDEELTAEQMNTNEQTRKKFKKRAKPLGISDDEEDDVEEEQNIEETEIESDLDDEEEDIDRYVEYDSDENEIEVKLTAKDVKSKASEYFENEAELSESEWGSEDEDEQNLNNYEAELGDEDEFDRAKVHSDLERIRLRQQIDQDAREVRIIKEMLFEEEEEKGDRERKFRWKHLDTTANLSDVNELVDGDDPIAHDSDDDNEVEWRRVRFEREQLLKQQMSSNETHEEATSNVTIDEQIGSTNINRTSNVRVTSIVKHVTKTANLQSPFLINKSDVIVQKGRKSFLGRDDRTLEKLLNLTKSGADGEAVANTANTKGQYVFTAAEKQNVLKRRSDNTATDDPTAERMTKKPKLSTGKSKAENRIFNLLN